jgi:hypothetical protein
MTLLAYIVAVLALLPALYGGVYGGSRALHHWQHGRCLARIEVLERDVYGLPLSDEAWSRYGLTALPLQAWRQREPQQPRRKPKSGETGAWFGGWER